MKLLISLFLALTAQAQQNDKVANLNPTTAENTHHDLYATECARAIHWLREATSAPNEQKNDYQVAANGKSIVVFDEGGSGDPIIYTKEGALHTGGKSCRFEPNETMDDFIASRIRLETQNSRVNLKDCKRKSETIGSGRELQLKQTLCFADYFSYCKNLGPKTVAAVRNVLK